MASQKRPSFSGRSAGKLIVSGLSTSPYDQLFTVSGEAWLIRNATNPFVSTVCLLNRN
jgi:hypothetical protein